MQIIQCLYCLHCFINPFQASEITHTPPPSLMKVQMYLCIQTLVMSYLRLPHRAATPRARGPVETSLTLSALTSALNPSQSACMEPNNSGAVILQHRSLSNRVQIF